MPLRKESPDPTFRRHQVSPINSDRIDTRESCITPVDAKWNNFQSEFLKRKRMLFYQLVEKKIFFSPFSEYKFITKWKSHQVGRPDEFKINIVMHMSGSFKLLILAKRTLISKTQIVSNKLQVDSIIFSWFIRIESTCSYHEPPRTGKFDCVCSGSKPWGRMYIWHGTEICRSISKDEV